MKPKPEEDSSPQPATKTTTSSSNPKSSKLSAVDDVLSSLCSEENKNDESENVKCESDAELKFFKRKSSKSHCGRKILPIQTMTLTESMKRYPDVPHKWHCDGKLLHLTDAKCSENHRMFSVSNVTAICKFMFVGWCNFRS